jgi:hypothetical protein
MNGDDIQVLVNSSIDEPSGLAIDYQMGNRIYWCDEKLSLVETIKPDGSDRRQIRHNLMHNPFKIDVFESHIYWLSRSTGSISKVDKFGRGAIANFVNGLDMVDDIKIFHKYKYPTKGSFSKKFVF